MWVLHVNFYTALFFFFSFDSHTSTHMKFHCMLTLIPCEYLYKLGVYWAFTEHVSLLPPFGTHTIYLSKLLMLKCNMRVLVMYHDHVCFNAPNFLTESIFCTAHELLTSVIFLKCNANALVFFNAPEFLLHGRSISNEYYGKQVLQNGLFSMHVNQIHSKCQHKYEISCMHKFCFFSITRHFCRINVKLTFVLTNDNFY